MSLSDRLQNKIHIENSLKAARAYRQELLTKLAAKIQQDDMRPVHSLTNGWQDIGEIHRDCDILEELLNETDEPLINEDYA